MDQVKRKLQGGGVKGSLLLGQKTSHLSFLFFVLQKYSLGSEIHAQASSLLQPTEAKCPILCPGITAKTRVLRFFRFYWMKTGAWSPACLKMGVWVGNEQQ